jgi:hypothetical protein
MTRKSRLSNLEKLGIVLISPLRNFATWRLGVKTALKVLFAQSRKDAKSRKVRD